MSVGQFSGTLNGWCFFLFVTFTTYGCFVEEGLLCRAPHTAIPEAGLPKLSVYFSLTPTKATQKQRGSVKIIIRFVSKWSYLLAYF